MDFPRKESPELDVEKALKFQIVDWYIPENDRNRPKPETPEEAELYTMIVYGSTEDGITVSARISGYEPYFYVKPPESWEEFSDSRFNIEVSKLKNIIKEEKYLCIFRRDGRETKYNKKIIANGYETHLNDVKVVKKKDFWGFTNNIDFRFIKISVKSLMMYNNLKYYFDSRKKEGFKMYESNIDPFLRYTHERDIKPCGWVSIVDYEEEENQDYFTRCDYNIHTDHQNVDPIVVNSIAPLLIASFDIECTSSHGDFPVPIKDYRKVAQDLANVAKAGYDITEEFILYWFETMYTQDAIIDDDIKINKVYPKRTVDFNKIKDKIIKESSKIIALLNEISIIAVDSDGDNDDEIQPVAKMTVKQQNIIEAKLNDILSRILPPLKGDKIIQIGTTVHKYGSEEIIYKNIISLNSCDDIEDTDVVSCKTEKQVILEWKKLMARLNPDILTGYNIFGFDMEYIWARAIENDIVDEFATGLGRNLMRKSTLIRQELSSSALGENILKYFDVDGTVCIDLFKVMQREHKLDSYKLDNVAQVFIGDRKDDLKPHEIFQKFKGSSEDRCVIAKYCIQDCALVNRLLHKLKILENNIGMGNVCLVPLNFLFRRGQGIKIFSLVAKQCMDRGYLIPVNKFSDLSDIDVDGYEGAVVLEPKEGIYLDDPIVVFDYGSLYPSSMIARNLSHDCYVMNPKYHVPCPNVEFTTVSYDLYEGLGDKKRKTGVKECVFAQYKDGKKGIISDILCMLLQERKNTKKKMEYETIIKKDKTIISGVVSEKDDDYEVYDIDKNIKTLIAKSDFESKHVTFNIFEQDVFDALQLAYKITANSLYGQIGAKTSPIYLKDIAACTTATGREMIMLAKNFVETKYNAEVIYGDSVMPHTPITYKTDDQIFVSTFEKFNGQWTSYQNFKPYDTDRFNKEQTMPINTSVWTHNGWSKIRRIIRHKTVKKIYRVVTQSGIVDVTEDHSLLDQNVNIVKPGECVVGQKLLHSQPVFSEYQNNVDKYQAYIYGQFVGKGKVFHCYCEDGTKYLWEINNNDFSKLVICREYLEKVENLKFDITIDENKYNENKYRLIIQDGQSNKNVNTFVAKYYQCYHNKNVKIVPHCVLNSSNEIKQAFKDGLDDAIDHNYVISSQITAQSYIVLFQMLGLCCEMLYDRNTITVKYGSDINDGKIKELFVLYNSYDGYVYDIETEEGVFHGGVGNMILKNTDSIFCKFPLKDENGVSISGKNSLKYAIEIGKHVEKNIVSIMPSPQKLNYEKSMYPFILFTKKRYVGNLYEMDTTKFKQKSMGIALKRRDNAPIVKKIYGGIIDLLLNKQDLDASIKFLKDELLNLVQGKTPITDLIISKSLRASYKDPTKISHKVLADRIGERDPGNKPQVNDRIPFVYIKVENSSGLQGDRIENPDYIIEQGLQPDSLHYITNQIMNPVLQLYALCLSQLPHYDKGKDYWEGVDYELRQKPMYQDAGKRKNRLDNLKLNMVKELLFDEFILMLTGPKVKKDRKTNSKITICEEEFSKQMQHISENCKESKTQEDVSQYEIMKADIKVTKKKSGNIEAIAKITKGKKSIWQYKNEECVDKDKEIITIIWLMVEFAKENKYKLEIKVNHKQFVTEYSSSVIYYCDLEKASVGGENIVRDTINSIDVGSYKIVSSIFKYEKILIIRQYFTILK